MAQIIAPQERIRRFSIVAPKALRTQVAAIIAAGAITAGYALLSAIGICWEWPHHEFWIAVLQLGILLPVYRHFLRKGPAGGPQVSVIVAPRVAWALVVVCFLVSAALSWRVSQGMLIPDEDAYRFETRALAMGRLTAPMPPGAPEAPTRPPRPLQFSGAVYFHGWFYKYPLGWPAVLALPDRLGIGWLVNPICGLLLLWIVAAVTREVFGPEAIPVAVAIAALSPYYWSNCVGGMSHGVAGVLVALACLLCIQAVRNSELWRLMLMFGALVFSIHVRIFTGAVAAVVLGSTALIMCRHRRTMLFQTMAIGAVAAIAALGSMMLYNHALTGHALESPYALSRGKAIPPEISASPLQIIRNIARYRGPAEATLAYSFPCVFVLAAYGIWVARRNSAALVLAALVAGMMTAYMMQPEPSSSVAGERYWFECYFCIAILAAKGLTSLFGLWKPSAQAVGTVCGSVFAVQVVLMLATAWSLDRLSSPQRKIEEVVRAHQNCDCVVFMDSADPVFIGHFNLNQPDWNRRKLFYAIDPGSELRETWAHAFGKPNWLVVGYDPSSRRASVLCQKTAREPEACFPTSRTPGPQ
jgi:hypothetical protein